MILIKRLHLYMLQRFVPLFMMTFFICLFIVLMQFLWRSIDDLVGKGLSVDILGELFFYAALTMVPMALPLAVLLASLMTFGNLGEHLELTAMKAAGISLFRIMKPLVVLMVLVAVGAFFFQNDVLPVAQTKMWTLLFSVRQKSPEVEIPEGSFYDQIPNMNLYIESKNRETGMLYGMIIYDMTKGADNSRVILADSGKFSFTEDRTRLFLHLYSGEMFDNMRENFMGNANRGYMPFRRENFSDKRVYFPFDANFNRMDEGGMRSQYIGQNVSQLRHSIDSIRHQVDSVGAKYGREIRTTPYFGLTPTVRRMQGGEMISVPRRQTLQTDVVLDVDSVFSMPSPSYAKSYITQALAKAKRQKQDYEYRSLSLSQEAKLMRRHDIEMQKKFTLSFACIIFFFIGAPLGAIIKKGGLGTPLIISVLLFIFYYIIDNTGYKMARDGKIAVWEGIWLSSAVLLPMGVFFTYKAVGDSAVFNVDAYRLFFRRLIGKEEKRSLERKEVIMNEVIPETAISLLNALEKSASEARNVLGKRPKILRPWLNRQILEPVNTALNAAVEYLADSDSARVIALLNRYPFRATSRNLDTIIKNTGTLLETYTDYGHKDKT